jgi:aryl-alcohol dehydrogenase-like predicted oxidoreductase
VSVVASAALVYGVLSGKYAAPGATGRVATELDEPFVKQPVEAAPALRDLAQRFSTTPAALAVASRLRGPVWQACCSAQPGRSRYSRT